MSEIKCVGILTSGGDAPGMNAAIRAVTRSAIFSGFKVKGIYRGYKGLISDEIQDFKTQNVSNIIQMGGTILKTARCPEFATPEGRQLAYDNIKRHEIDALVVIGGDGSLTGARVFANEFNFPCISNSPERIRSLRPTTFFDIRATIRCSLIYPTAKPISDGLMQGIIIQIITSGRPTARSIGPVKKHSLFMQCRPLPSFQI